MPELLCRKNGTVIREAISGTEADRSRPTPMRGADRLPSGMSIPHTAGISTMHRHSTRYTTVTAALRKYPMSPS